MIVFARFQTVGNVMEGCEIRVFGSSNRPDYSALMILVCFLSFNIRV